MRTIVAIPSDTHCGGKTALMPPGQWALNSGGYYSPSFSQNIIWRQWKECWERVGELRKGGRLIAVHNGDAIDGNHHDSVELVSPSLEEQERIFIECYEQALIMADVKDGDQAYFLAGTEAHSGQLGRAEERIAREFDISVPYSGSKDEHGGRFVFPHLLLDVNGVLFDIAHHGGSVGRRMWTRTNGLQGLLINTYLNRLDSRKRIPNYLIFGHNHTWGNAIYRGNQGTTEAFTLPSFQLKTGYAHARMRSEISTIGMLVVVVEDDGSHRWECIRMNFEEERIITA